MKKLWSTLLASVAALAILIAPDAARADEESDRLAALGKAQTYTVKTTGPASPIDMGGAAILVNAPLAEVRAVLEYIDCESKRDDGVRDWPFPDELAEHWRVVKPDGTEVEIMPPVVDFADGYVTWR